MNIQQPQTILVYHSAGRYIITLSLDLSSPHDLDRDNVVDANFALFRCKQAFVKKIECKYDLTKVVNEYKNFKCGEIINENEYDNDVNKIWRKGITFYKTKEPAFQISDIAANYGGIYTVWYDNGQKQFVYNYLDGKINKISVWYENGQKKLEFHYVDGEENGIRSKWYENGQKEFEKYYVDGKENGISRGYYENGQKHYEENFVDGEKNGLYKGWYENGQKSREEHYVGGKEKGISRGWYENGQKFSESVNGICMIWNKNGLIDEGFTYVTRKKCFFNIILFF